MMFTVRNPYKLQPEQLRVKTLLSARSFIRMYPMRATELALDEHLQQQYDTTLKNACLVLLLNASYTVNDLGELVILFKNPQHDKVAQLITYGNGQILGSQILRHALANY